jgi:hypothetical protein
MLLERRAGQRESPEVFHFGADGWFFVKAQAMAQNNLRNGGLRISMDFSMAKSLLACIGNNVLCARNIGPIQLIL